MPNKMNKHWHVQLSILIPMLLHWQIRHSILIVIIIVLELFLTMAT